MNINTTNFINNVIQDYIKHNGDEIDIYVDYNDNISDETVAKEILNSKGNNEDNFYDLIQDCFMESGFAELDTVRDNIYEIIEQNEKIFETDDDEEIRDYLREGVNNNFTINFPFDHFKEKTYNTLIFLTPKLCTDRCWEKEEKDNFVLNEEFEQILNILKVTPKDFLDFLENKSEGSTIIKEIYQEALNILSGYNEFAFLAYVSLGALIEYKEGNPILIKSGTCCGFLDTVNGSGSTLDVRLNDDLFLNPEQYSLRLDCEFRYNVDSIYGMGQDIWRKGDVICDKEKIKKLIINDYIKKIEG